MPLSRSDWIDTDGLFRRRAVLEQRYLDACHDYNLARTWYHPIGGVLVHMEQAESALAEVDSLLGRPQPQQRKKPMENLFGDVPQSVHTPAPHATRVGKELALAAEVPHGTAEEAGEFLHPCPSCLRKVLSLPMVMGDKAEVIRFDTDKDRPKTYIVTWNRQEKRYDAYESAAYPVHRCHVVAQP
jgi:hypothetical protein